MTRIARTSAFESAARSRSMRSGFSVSATACLPSFCQRAQSTEFFRTNRLTGTVACNQRGVAAVGLKGTYADLRPLAPRFPPFANLPEAVNSLRSVGRAHGLHRHPSAPPLHFRLADAVRRRWRVRLSASVTRGQDIEAAVSTLQLRHFSGLTFHNSSLPENHRT